MENFGIGAGMAAMAFWGFIAVAVIAGVWDNVRKREAQHETVRRLIESGKTIDPAVVDKLLQLSDGKSERLDRDFKVAGLWMLPISVGLVVLGLIMGFVHPAIIAPVLGAAGLVACIGAGALYASTVAARWYDDDDASSQISLED
ncbi:MAG: hypothetical protein JKY60_15230 [Kordiimonadaceae bacterium]|nr:hypothetical protein [Kordiimonadaceae bacterium]